MNQGKLLLVHGAGGDARTWGPVIDQLPPTYDVRAITLSYFGKTEWPDGGSGFGTERHANDIIGYIETLMEPPVNLAAWSYGAHPALLAALRRPDLIGSMFIYEPGLATYIDRENERTAFKQDFADAFGPVIAQLASEGVEGAIAAMFDAVGGNGFFRSLPEDRREIALDNAGMMPLLLGKGQPPTVIRTSDLSSVKLPVTVGMGGQTRPLFAIPAAALASAIPEAIFLTIDQADHMLPEKDPAKFAGQLDMWLSRIEGTT